jgi:penicillin-binding protein 1A
MGEERPAFKAEAEPKQTARDYMHRALVGTGAFFAREAEKTRSFVEGLRWPSDWRRQVRWPVAIFGSLAGIAFLGCVTLFLVMSALAPPIPMNADLYVLNRPAALTFKDETGQVLGVRGAVVGERLKLAEMPSFLPAAFLAMEDRKFYRHHGVDPSGLARAAIVDFKARRIVQGGSTITQQVVKIVLLSPDRTFSRKLTEIAGAFALENELTKDQILELYLNRLYLGSGAYGVDGAARIYFGKSARDVTLSEAAMLAALTRAPTAFSPRRDLIAAQARAGRVLGAMVANGALTKAQADRARANPATVIDPTQNLARDYYLDAAAEEVKQVLPQATGDLTVITAMDPALQEAARTGIVNMLDKRATQNAHATQAALVSMTPDGAVRALIGGKDYAESPFNRVTKAHRQPGSAFKPFVYLAALEHGLTPATVRVDEPITIKDWSPDNYNEGHLGPVTLEQAFAQSINTVAVGLGQEVGLPQVVSTAHRLGIRSPLQPVASLALGTSEVTPLELTGAYASFASMGRRVRPYMVVAVWSPNGAVLYHHDAPPSAQLFSEDVGLAMNGMMYSVVQTGTGRGAAVPGHEVAGKTGTSADYRDAWFVGFSPELVTGVWVGNDDFSAMKKITGGSLPAQIWSGFMRVALKNAPHAHLPRAEPVPPYIAEDTAPDGENLIQRGFEGIGNFFDRLFGGGNANAAAPAPKDRSSSADDGNAAREEGQPRYARGEPAPVMSATVPYQRTAPADISPAPERSNGVVAPPPAQPRGETYVFQNGDTGESQVFQAPSRQFSPLIP